MSHVYHFIGLQFLAKLTNNHKGNYGNLEVSGNV